jgi:CubicO group peptidase (beta-lactamase class C family)
VPKLKSVQSRQTFAVILVVGLIVFMLVTNLSTPGPSTLPVRDYWPTDGWQSAPPQDHGMDMGTLDRLHQHIESNLPNLYSVLIVREGYIVYENYYEGFYAEFPFEVASVTKSITSALVGIALEKGYIESLDQHVIEFFPEYEQLPLGNQITHITLRHILSMTSGFEWSEEGTWLWPREGDWMEFALKMDNIHTPGEVFTYNTPATHLLSGVLTKTTSMSEAEFAQTHLFDPLGIAPPEWSTDPTGYTTGAHALNLTVRDMAKLGYLYLNNGLWDGQQVVPQEWIELSTQSHSGGGFPQYAQYGYLWWVTTERGHQAYFAAGYGGQYLYIIPDLDMVVVITSDTSQEHPENRAIVGEYIIPAAR